VNSASVFSTCLLSSSEDFNRAERRDIDAVLSFDDDFDELAERIEPGY
jgi:hypothetical protein